MYGTGCDPWLICLAKLATFLEVPYKILQDSALFLQKLQKMQNLERFLQETSDLFIFLAGNLYRVDQTFPCKILSRNLQDFSVLAR